MTPTKSHAQPRFSDALHRPRRGRKAANRCGAMLVLIILMMMGFMLAMAFSVDIARMHLSRTELRTATDAASKAAAVTLAETMDIDVAITRGQQLAAANTVNGAPLLLDRHDFVFGRSEEQSSGKYEFTAGGLPRNSVRVDAGRTCESPSGPVPSFFGKSFGVEFYEPRSSVSATYIDRDIVLVVDRSGSMRGQRFGDLVSAIDTFTQTLDETPVNEQVGLASYSDDASEDVPLTEDLTEITRGIRSLGVGGDKSIPRGMEAGANVMKGSRGAGFVERILIVMTDGGHKRGAEPRTFARRLAADGVTIHTITFGSDADLRQMQELAAIGGGRHYHADNGLELREVYRELALTLTTIMTE